MNISIGMVGDGGTKWTSIDAQAEQDERIRENIAEWRKNPGGYSFNDFDEIFEDRDPFEFL